MPIPTKSDVYVDRLLTNLVEAYNQSQNDFVSMTVFPPCPVTEVSGLYFRWKREDFFRDNMKVRAPGTQAEAGGTRLDTGTFVTEEYAETYPISDSIRRTASPMLNLDFAGTDYLASQALLNRETKWNSTFFANGVWGTSITGQATSDSTHIVFWNASGSDPVADVIAGKETIKSQTAKDPNVLVLGYKVKNRLKTNASIIDRLKYGTTDRSIVTVKDTDLAQLFEVDKVVTMGAVKTTSNEGAATPTFDFIGGKHALLAYAAPSPGPMVASAGYTFNMGLPGAAAGGVGWRIKKYRMENLGSDILEVEQIYGHGLVSPVLGYFFNAVVQ